jgi:splicing factor 3A subunit 3
MDSILEQQRALHEEIERLESAIAQVLVERPKTHKDRIVQEHKVNAFLEGTMAKSRSLLELYNDQDGYAFIDHLLLQLIFLLSHLADRERRK